jgi:hypothetical protein
MPMASGVPVVGRFGESCAAALRIWCGPSGGAEAWNASATGVRGRGEAFAPAAHDVTPMRIALDSALGHVRAYATEPMFARYGIVSWLN